jgi:hypothetical protein
MFLTPEDLMAGGSLCYEVEIPPEVLAPGEDGTGAPQHNGNRVKLRPLTVRDVQLIAKAAREDEVLTSVLMIQKAMVEPELEKKQIAAMHSGLVRYLVDQINRISGLHTTDDEMQALADSPLVRAFFVLAKEFNWSPQQVREMTVGQILGYLELLNQTKGTLERHGH